MISFWGVDTGLFGITNYLADRGAPIREQFAIRPYSGMQATMAVGSGAHIFAALDQLTPAGREAVGVIYDQLAAQQPGVSLLNDPRRTLLREVLLTGLADAGINRFRVYRGETPEAVGRFPVFVREASGHSGNLTGLLDSPRTLRRALRALRVRGHHPANLLLVEYCHTADREGLFRKYAAFKVGPAIIPCHLLVGQQWMLKASSDTKTMEHAREELAYVTGHPHAAWLKQVFDLAGAGYGRIDYGVQDGVLQVWEINLDPTIGRQPGAPRRYVDPEVAPVREESRAIFHSQLRKAFLALGPPGASETFHVELEPSLLARIARESARIRRRQAVVEFLANAYARFHLQSVLRRFFPRR